MLRGKRGKGEMGIERVVRVEGREQGQEGSRDLVSERTGKTIRSRRVDLKHPSSHFSTFTPRKEVLIV